MREGEREQEDCDVQDGAKPMVKIETLLMPLQVRNDQSAHYCYERNVRVIKVEILVSQNTNVIEVKYSRINYGWS